MKTIEEAKSYLRANATKGTNCPCCTQRVQFYKVKLNSTMVKMLVEFYNKHGSNNYREHKSISNGSGDFAKMKHWGLVAEAINYDTKKKNSGIWCVTTTGEKFVKGNCTVMSRGAI